MGGSAWRVCPCELCVNSSSAQSLMLSFAHAVPTLFYLLNYMTLFLCRLFLLPCSCCYFYPPKRKEKNTKTNSSPLWAVMTSGFCFYQRLGSWFHWSVPVFLERSVCVCSATACCSVQINRLFGLLAIIRLLNALKPCINSSAKLFLNLYHLIRKWDCCRLFLEHFKLNRDLYFVLLKKTVS